MKMKRLDFAKRTFSQAALLAGMALIAFGSLLSSCGDDDGDNGNIKGDAKSLIIGEWGEVKTESYRYDEGLVRTWPGYRNGKEAAWIFGENGYFQYAVYASQGDAEGTYSISGNNLRIKCGYWDNPNFTVLKLDKDSLIVRQPYEDTEYDYEIYYYKRLSFYGEGDGSDLDAEARNFVGTWSYNNHYWYFAPDGKLYVSKDEHVNQENYIAQKEWSYDAETRTLATSMFWEDVYPGTNYTWGNYNYSWTVLVVEDNFWTGKCLYADGEAATFERVE